VLEADRAAADGVAACDEATLLSINVRCGIPGGPIKIRSTVRTYRHSEALLIRSVRLMAGQGP